MNDQERFKKWVASEMIKPKDRQFAQKVWKAAQEFIPDAPKNTQLCTRIYGKEDGVCIAYDYPAKLNHEEARKIVDEFGAFKGVPIFLIYQHFNADD